MYGLEGVLMKADWQIQQGKLKEINSIGVDCLIIDVNLKGYEKMDSFVNDMKMIIRTSGNIKVSNIIMYLIDNNEPFIVKFEWQNNESIFFNLKQYFMIRKLKNIILKIK